jgi:hypothetical protein
MKAGWKVLSCLVLLAVLTWAGTALAISYVNLVPGTEKWFTCDNADRCLTQKMHTVVIDHPGGLYVVQKEILLDGQVLSVENRLFDYDADGKIYFYGTLEEPFLDTPILWVDAPLRLGQTWTDSRTVISSDDEPNNVVHYIFAVLDLRRITCPAGSFDCYQVLLTEVQPDGQATNCTFWYNESCGLVRCCLEDSRLFNLTKVIPGDNGDPDDQIHNPLPDEGLIWGLRGAPNPANPMTTVRFDLKDASAVQVAVFDISGRLVRRLMQDQFLPAGPVSVGWDGADEMGQAAASGTYLVQVKAGQNVASQRVTLVR